MARPSFFKVLKSNIANLNSAYIFIDIGAINIDTNLIKRVQLFRQNEKHLEMQKGYICFKLRSDLKEITKLVARGDANYLIKSSSISESVQVPETFSYELSSTIADRIEELEFDFESLSSDVRMFWSNADYLNLLSWILVWQQSLTLSPSLPISTWLIFWQSDIKMLMLKTRNLYKLFENGCEMWPIVEERQVGHNRKKINI